MGEYLSRLPVGELIALVSVGGGLLIGLAAVAGRSLERRSKTRNRRRLETRHARPGNVRGRNPDRPRRRHEALRQVRSPKLDVGTTSEAASEGPRMNPRRVQRLGRSCISRRWRTGCALAIPPISPSGGLCDRPPVSCRRVPSKASESWSAGPAGLSSARDGRAGRRRDSRACRSG